ncbi:FMN-binding negative transcriptional regulator [Poseidonocella sp. HB161398]|uniref:FMN-binding negative transcriptional regulator n=1 Tax=Poseidonocella sp. HB161398 TaxID=2320855 RepID=UPI001108531C|nr:FMN-binding negative transcriptional regulator [Poseidonocella sp. HB161398]
MYSKPEFAPLSAEAPLALIDAAVMATVFTPGEDGAPAAVSHLPFLVDRGGGGGGLVLVSHAARANPHAARIAAGCAMVAVFSGPQGYISSSWYPRDPERDSAPTWNYAAVHCHGRAVALDAPGTARHLAALVARLEHGRADAWSLEELGPGGMGRRLPHVQGFELHVERLEASYKMGQDERLRDTRAAIERLGAGAPALAEMMAGCNRGRS